ncbi:MAG TPA: asparagine synthase (glutamine-hydrolyzing) [Rubrivivax sp.]|nr:asparagine synthase (glutamine-hydrolyzing) [Rubrivivax sp.]
MCGIAGVITLAPSAADLRPQLQAAAAALRHRGPDDFGITLDGPVGLVHTRLSIIDLAGGHQPIVSPDQRLSAVVNGEIYNYVELRAEFSARNGAEPLTHSDSESVLQVYAAEGVAGLGRLHGMFAMALHDRAQRRLVLARDRLGIKPLYLYRDASRVAFASELKALLPLLPKPPALHADAIAQFLEHEFASGEQTAFAGITRVPPAHALSIDYSLGIERQCYWSLQPLRTHRLDMAQAQEAFSTLFEQVMREHMRADVPFGLFLSGGVDSSLLCAMLKQLHGQAIESFSIGYSVNRERNELDDAQTVARRFGTRHHAIEITPEELLARIPHAVWSTDELMRDFAVLPTSLLAERAGQSLKVIFTGEGGDEAFAGYARFRKHPLQRWLSNLRRPGTGGLRTRSHWPDELRQRVWSPRLQAVSHGFRRAQAEAWQAAPRQWSSLQRLQYYDLVAPLADKLLVKVDRSLMAWGVEARVPYLDHRIVEFGLSLPDALKVQGRVGKLFLRRWGQRHIPGNYLMQSKKGFHVPVGQLLSGEFLARLGQALDGNAAVREWFDPAGVAQLVEQQQRTGACGVQVWGVMQFAIWHRLFVEQPGRLPARSEDPLDWVR